MAHEDASLVGLSRRILDRLDISPLKHKLHTGRYQDGEEFHIWTLLESEIKPTPYGDLTVMPGGVCWYSGHEGSEEGDIWLLADYDFTTNVGFDKLMGEINEALRTYYKKFELKTIPIFPFIKRETTV